MNRSTRLSTRLLKSFGAFRMQAVQSQFAQVPLFDQSLNEELQALERRQSFLSGAPSSARRGHEKGGPVFYSMQSQPHGQPSTYTTGQFSPLSVELSGKSSSPSPSSAVVYTDTNSNSHSPGRAAWDNRYGRHGPPTFTLPPKITRPWSVEMLMRRGEALHSALRQPQFRTAPERIAVPGGRTSTQQKYNTKSPRRAGGRSKRQGNSPNAADSSSENEEYQRRHGGSHAGSARMTAARPEDALLHEEQPLSAVAQRAAEELVAELDDYLLGEQIERAAARKSMQEERLNKLGLPLPGAVGDGGTQTDRALTRFHPDQHGIPPEREKSALDESIAKLLQRATSTTNTTPSSPRRGVQGLDSSAQTSPPRGALAREATRKVDPRDLVLDAAGYRPAAASFEAASGDTVWRRMLLEEKNPARRPPNTPSAYQLATMSSAEATPQRARAGRSHMARDELAVPSDRSKVLSTQPEFAAPIFETKHEIMRQLDRMQLANEEMLVRNKILTGGVPDVQLSSAHNALAHIAEARRVAHPAGFAAPIGGYGSVADRRESGPEHADHVMTSESDRWASAGVMQQLHTENRGFQANQAMPLRRWASDNANQVPSAVVRSTLPRHTPGGSIGGYTPNFSYAPSAGSQGYDARKKWENVRFAAGDVQPSQNVNLNDLSATASEWMQTNPQQFF